MTDDEFKKIYQNFTELQTTKTDQLKESTELFTKLSDGFIKADFTKTIDTIKLSAEIASIFSSHSLNIQKSRCDQLSEIVSTSPVPVKKWEDIVYEIKSLVEFNLAFDAQEELPHTPIIDSAGFTASNNKENM